MQLKHSSTTVLFLLIQMLKFHEGTLWTLKCKPFSMVILTISGSQWIWNDRNRSEQFVPNCQLVSRSWRIIWQTSKGLNTKWKWRLAGSPIIIIFNWWGNQIIYQSCNIRITRKVLWIPAFLQHKRTESERCHSIWTLYWRTGRVSWSFFVILCLRQRSQ